jgi:hypothetical protein
MNETTLFYSYIVAMFFYGGAVLLSLFQERLLGMIAYLIALLSHAFNIVLIICIANRLPLYGPFESIMYISFLASVFGIRYYFERNKFKLAQLTTISIFLLMSLLIFYPVKLNYDYFMYDNIWVILFFQLRLMAMSCFLYALIYYIAALRLTNSEQIQLCQYGRLLLLLGSGLFLGGEFAGTIWCFNGWADVWRWSKGFYRSASIFLLIMLVFHLPVKWRSDYKKRILLGIIAPVCVLAIFLYDQLCV